MTLAEGRSVANRSPTSIDRSLVNRRPVTLWTLLLPRVVKSGKKSQHSVSWQFLYFPQTNCTQSGGSNSIAERDTFDLVIMLTPGAMGFMNAVGTFEVGSSTGLTPSIRKKSNPARLVGQRWQFCTVLSLSVPRRELPYRPTIVGRSWQRGVYRKHGADATCA